MNCPLKSALALSLAMGLSAAAVITGCAAERAPAAFEARDPVEIIYPAAEPPAGGGADEPQDREAALLFNTASRLYRQENWKEAAAAFGDFLKRYQRHPDAGEAHFARGYCLNRLGQHAAAAEDLRSAAAYPESSWSSDAHFYLARSLEALAGEKPAGSDERRARLAEAAASYGQAARLYAGALAKTAERGDRSREKEGDAAAARRRLLDLQVLSISSQGEALYQAGSFPEAARALAVLEEKPDSLAESPNYARGLYILGLSQYALASALEESGRPADYAAARRLLARFSAPDLEKDPLAVEAEFLLARLLHRLGERRDAVEHYARVERRQAAHAAEALYYRALALHELRSPENVELAAAEFARFLKANSGHELATRARFYEALCYFDLGNHSEAARRLSGFADGAGDLAGLANLRLGQALLLKQPSDPAAAAAALEKAAAALRGGRSAPPDQVAEAAYWRGEALLARGGESLAAAAKAFEAVADGFRENQPELAEKALYQEARAWFLSGDRRRAAAAAASYRERYPRGGKFLQESLVLSAENAFRAGEDNLDASERRAAARYYAEAATLARDPVEARRLRYLAGVATYYSGDFPAAAEALGKVLAEDRAKPLAGFAQPELPFYLADSLAQQPRPEKPAAEDLERWRRAAGLFKEYLAGNRSGAQVATALLNLGLCQKWLEDHAGARETFAAFLETQKGHRLAPQVRLELANADLALGDLEAGAAEYRRAASEAAGTALAARALLQAASLQRRLGHPMEAIEALDELERGGIPQDLGSEALRIQTDAHHHRAMALREAGKAPEARAELTRHLERFPSSPHAGEARLQLAHLLLEAAEPRAALVILSPLVEARPPADGRDQALYLSAWCYAGMAKDAAEGVERDSHLREMESAYRRLIAEHGASDFALDARLELGQHLFNRRAYAEAKEWFQAVRQAAEAPGAGQRARDLLDRSLFGLGFIAAEEKDHARARDLFDAVARNQASDLAPRALFQAARAWMLSREEAKAAERFERLVGEMRPRAGDLVEESLLRLGECRHRLGKYQEAARVLEQLLKDFPQGELRHEARFALGFARQFLDDFEGATAAYRLVVASTAAPVAARAQYHIGECFADQGKHREAAREYLTVAANFDLEGPYQEWVRRALLGAGMSYLAAGDHKAARAQFDELLKRFPNTEEGKAAAQRLETAGK